MPKIVGIDLGTTNSLVAIVENGVPRVIPGPDGINLVPSVIYFEEAGEPLVGNSAKARMVDNPENAIFYFLEAVFSSPPTRRLRCFARCC